MSAIFISHSSEDRAAAQEMMQRLRAQNYEAVFLDFDGEHGIAAGKDWEAELYRNVSICRAAIVLLSERWLASRWCFAEFCLAKTLGKEIFPVRIAPCRTDTLLGRLQIIDLPTEGESGYGRLWGGLREAGLDPADDFAVDRTRPPYPGFNYFEEKDAGIYFGRDAEIKLVLDALTRMSNRREPPLVVVIGGSGSGKSSLVRAGVVPRLKKNSKSWIVVPPFRPGRNGVSRLAQALADSFAKEWNRRVAWEEIRDQILDGGETSNGKEGHTGALLQFVADLTTKVGHEDPNRVNATVVVVVDQFEELLLGREKPPPRDGPRVSETDVFLELLRGLYEHSEGTVQVLATLRSDFFGAFLNCIRLSGNEFENIALAPMPNEAFFQVIEGPAARFGVNLEAALVNRMVADTGTDDALPLLAFTLREMWERSRRGMPFSLEVYDKQLGGIQGAVQRVVDEIRIDPSQEPDLRRTFLKMVRVNEDESFVRQPARWSELPESAQRLLRQFVEARLLSSDGEKVEAVHESLFRVWNKLAGWLADSREFLLWKKRTDVERRVWEKSGFPEAFLLKEGRLAEAERFMGKYDQDLTPELLDFVEKSSKQHKEELRQEHQRQQRELDAARKIAETERQRAEVERQRAEGESQARRRQRFLIIGLVGLLLLAGVIGVVAVWQWSSARIAEEETKKEASQANVSLAHYSHQAGNDAQALAHLAQALRLNQSNYTASALICEMLIQHGWPIPLADPMRHNSSISSAQFSPDGQRVVTASADKTARLWDATTGKPIGEPMRHAAGVNSAQFSPDGQRVVTASDDKAARLWDATTGKPIGEPMRHAAGVNSAQFSLDGQRVVTASEDSVRLWDAATGKPIGEPMRREGTPKLWVEPGKAVKQEDPFWGLVNSAQFSPDGQTVVAALRDGTVWLWDATTRKPIGEPMRHAGSVNSAQFSPDGHRVVTASNDKTARLWEAATGKPIGEPMEHKDVVYSAQFSPDGQRVVTASRDGTVWLWDATTGIPIGEPMRHAGSVYSTQFGPDGQRLVTVSSDKTAQLWDAATGKPIGEPMRHAAGVNSAQFSPDGQRVVTALSDGTAWLWDVASSIPFGQPMQHAGNIRFAHFSPDGQRIATASWGETAWLWDAATGKPIGDSLQHGNVVASAQFSHDGQRIVTISPDKTAQLREAATGKPIGEPMQHKDVVNSAQFSPDDQRVVTASRDKTAQLWEAATGKPIGEPMQHKDVVNSAQFSPDGRRVVTASRDKTAQLWEAATGKPIGEPMQHKDVVNSAQFSPDGRRVVTVSQDTTARLWDATTGKPIGEPMQHAAGVNSAQFSLDGQRVVTASADRTARLWDATAGKPIGEPMQHEGNVISAQFSPDGQRVVTASQDTTARLWDAATGKPIGEPMRHGSNDVFAAEFSPDSQRVVTASENEIARLWDVPTISSKDTAEDTLLLADLADEATGGVTTQTFGQAEIRNVWSPEQVRLTREKIANRFATKSSTFTPLQRFLLWSASEPRNRMISPFSEITFAHWVESTIQLAQGGYTDSLRVAMLVDPTNARVAAHYARRLAEYYRQGVGPTESGYYRRMRAEVDFLMRRALKLAPDHGEVKTLCMEIVKLLHISSE
jgi:WD40 repeat protein